MTSRSEVHHANHYTIEASYKKGQIFHVESYNVLLFCEVKIEMPLTYNEWILGPRWFKNACYSQHSGYLMSILRHLGRWSKRKKLDYIVIECPLSIFTFVVSWSKR